MNENMYKADEDISAAESKQQELNHGRFLASKVLIAISGAQNPEDAIKVINASELVYICNAAVESESTGRISALENEKAELLVKLNAAEIKISELKSAMAFELSIKNEQSEENLLEIDSLTKEVEDMKVSESMSIREMDEFKKTIRNMEQDIYSLKRVLKMFT